MHSEETTLAEADFDWMCTFLVPCFDHDAFKQAFDIGLERGDIIHSKNMWLERVTGGAGYGVADIGSCINDIDLYNQSNLEFVNYLLHHKAGASDKIFVPSENLATELANADETGASTWTAASGRRITSMIARISTLLFDLKKGRAKLMSIALTIPIRGVWERFWSVRWIKTDMAVDVLLTQYIASDSLDR